MDSSVKSVIDDWLNSSIDEVDKEVINSLVESGNETELVDSFYKELEFGTGGLRGIMGIGPNRMNKYTIGMATQGLANYLNAVFEDEPISVAIAYDSRNNSDFFAQTTANVFAANDIKVYLFDELRPTPELSFAIRYLKCKSGVVITASHNPKEYSGYKAYWDDGSQIIAPHDENIIKEVRKISDVSKIKFNANPDLIQIINKEIDEAYLEAVSQQVLSPEAIENQKDLSIVFSPIHGTGITMVPPILKKNGFNNLHIVKEQATPDGDFPTVVYPNPEEQEAMSMALNQAEKINADLVLATDPDADRVGIAVKNSNGQFQLLNGNQTGVLIVYYLCKMWKEKGKLDGNQFVVKTIVTTELIKDIAESFGIESYDTLTGFKFIAGLIRELEGKKKFIGGGEESYGYLIGDSVRDKDAVASCAIIAEIAAWAKENGKSLYDVLMDIYAEYGLYNESMFSITKKGKEGAEQITEMMRLFRENPPSTLGDSKISIVIDYHASTSKSIFSGETQKINFPKSNVLQFITNDKTKISIRPSGTEPKIKFYFGVFKILNPNISFTEEIGVLIEKVDKIKKQLDLS
ncbi:MAG: phospho-sugar mutase [Cyclobacteriaceae bacterium]|nr:phospho-sugar mutase [Cyclobacteriaceae bacterium]